MIRARIAAALYNFRAMTLRAELHTEPRSHEQLRNAVLRYGRVDEDRRTAEVRVCVRLTRAETGTDPVFELLANEKLFSEEELGAHSVARAILDSVYAGAPRDMRNVPPPPPSHVSVSLGPQRIRLCDDQARAVSLGEERPPVLAIQAAYGTGKTVVAALLAARLASQGHLVVATATTNVAVAQFAETCLKLNDY
ncbi:hypothetical protein GCK32_022701 [Trichostrongylus colubriformis]|uniref:DNA2/NAM7 helicase helicase domain-containing protein n=1 Tax=Trichostrongylus colubriformis TaxID=6319 RepID=A0AAN8F890_TRICO